MKLKINGSAPDWWFIDEPSVWDNIHVYSLHDERAHKIFYPVVEKVMDGFVNEFHNLVEIAQCFPCG